MKMHITVTALVCSIFCMSAQAACYGSGSFYTCSDDSGNTYNVSKYGNQTQVNGYNGSTGGTWNQHSTTVGNTTYHNGTAANGNSWNGTTTTYGDTTTHSGTSSNGSIYHKTCNAYGCH